MKKIVALLLTLILTGCVRYNIWNPPKVEEIDPVELIGIQGEPLRGKLWMSTCQSNAFGDLDTAKETALVNMAKKADELGYKYFTLLDRHTSMQENLGSYTTNRTSTSFTNLSLNTSSNGTITTPNNSTFKTNSTGTAHGTAMTMTTTPETHYYKTRFHTFRGIFFLLDENDLKKAPNVYSVDKYLDK